MSLCCEMFGSQSPGGRAWLRRPRSNLYPRILDRRTVPAVRVPTSPFEYAVNAFPQPRLMFDDVRQAFRDLLRGTPPSGDARRSIVAQMRETLVQARMGLDDLRKGVEETQARLKRERTELETVRRRKELAQGINDAETIAIAERYEKQHTERVSLLERKLETQEAELAMVEREVGEMNAEFKLAAAGGTPGVSAGSSPSAGEAEQAVNDAMGENAGLRDEIDGLARARRRANAETEADEKLAALKRRMGK